MFEKHQNWNRNRMSKNVGIVRNRNRNSGRLLVWDVPTTHSTDPPNSDITMLADNISSFNSCLAQTQFKAKSGYPASILN